MTTILIRTLILYGILLFSVRLMGKRQIGQLQAGEFVAAILISELASIPMTDADIPISHGILPLMIVCCGEIITAFLSRKSSRVRLVLDGKPIVLFDKGRFIESNLEKARVSEDEVRSQARLKGYREITEVETVILEQSGEMSVFPKEDK